MVVLDCTVKTCTHNAENCCCKGTILVEGPESKTTESTYCGSFEERTNDSFSNSYETPGKKLEVQCEAMACTYNEQNYCKADRIGISGSNAHESGETECASFLKNHK